MNQYSAACNSLCLSPELVPGAVAPLEAEDPGIQRNQPGPKKYNTADPLKGLNPKCHQFAVSSAHNCERTCFVAGLNTTASPRSPSPSSKQGCNLV